MPLPPFSQGPGGIPWTRRRNPLLLGLPGHVPSWKGPRTGLRISPGQCGESVQRKSRAPCDFRTSLFVGFHLSQYRSSYCMWQDLSLAANGKGFQNNVPALARPIRASELQCMGRGGGDHCGQSRYLKGEMRSSAALPRSWEGVIGRSERSRGPLLTWKGFRDSGTTQQGLGIQGLLGNSPKQSPHTLRPSRFKRERSGGAETDSLSG